MKYAIIEKTSTYVPGDERSRTHPGHGYPEHTVSHLEFREFDSEDDLVRHLASLGRYSTKPYKIIRYEELELETTIEVKLK